MFWLIRLWLRWKHRDWQPAVGDIVLHECLLGWVPKRVEMIHPDGQLRLTTRIFGSESTYSSGSYPVDAGVLFTGDRL